MNSISSKLLELEATDTDIRLLHNNKLIFVYQLDQLPEEYNEDDVIMVLELLVQAAYNLGYINARNQYTQGN